MCHCKDHLSLIISFLSALNSTWRLTQSRNHHRGDKSLPIIRNGKSRSKRVDSSTPNSSIVGVDSNIGIDSHCRLRNRGCLHWFSNLYIVSGNWVQYIGKEWTKWSEYPFAVQSVSGAEAAARAHCAFTQAFACAMTRGCLKRPCTRASNRNDFSPYFYPTRRLPTRN